MLDLAVRGGLLFDGTGRRPRRADLGVRDGQVAWLDPGLKAPARETLDASGLWIAPGFVDIHTHYDIELEIAPGLSESVRHGVTSVVMGHCSLSLTVGQPQTLADIFLRVENIPQVLVRKWLSGAVDWKTPRDYFAHLRGLPMGPNVAAMLGHSALRAHVMGLERSLQARADETELKSMRRLAEEALEAGCVGISVDMVPWHMMTGRFKGRAIPSHHADYREYAMLADVCRRRDAVYQVSPNPQNLWSLVDILRLSLPRAGNALRLTVLAALDSACDRRLWRSFGPILRVLNDGLGCNVRFQTIAEPFTVFSDGPLTPLFEEFPAGVLLNDQETRAQRRALWRDPAFRAGFRRQWLDRRRATFHRDLGGMRILSAPEPGLEGLTFEDAARLRGVEAEELFMALLELHDTDLRWVATGANDRPQPRQRLLSHPFILPGFSDAGAHVRNLGFYDSALSLLREAVQTDFMSPERAIHRCTREAAAWYGLDAGTLRPGSRADFVLLDPAGLDRSIPPQVAVQDPVLDGAMRLVKRPRDGAVQAVAIGGRTAWSGAEGPELGRRALGILLSSSPADQAAEKRRLRDRVSDEIIDHPFTEYWEVFLLKHQDPRNVAAHCLGVIVWYGLAAAAVARREPWMLLLLPVSQIIGLVGHFLFEQSHIDLRDAAFSVRASRALNRMFWRVITGRYFLDVRRARRRLEAYLEGYRDDVLPTRSREPSAA